MIKLKLNQLFAKLEKIKIIVIMSKTDKNFC